MLPMIRGAPPIRQPRPRLRVLDVRSAYEGGEPNQTARSVATGATHSLHTSCAPHRLHTVDSTATVFTPSTPLAVGVLRVHCVCEGGEPNQTAHSVDTGASHRLHTSYTTHRLHTSCATHRLHTVDSSGRRRPARALRLRRRRAQSDCSFRRHRRAPPSSHLVRHPQSSHRRLHCPSASCACAAPRLRRKRAQSDCSFRRHRRAPPSSHRRLHCPSASCACSSAMYSRNGAPEKEESPIKLLVPSPPAVA